MIKKGQEKDIKKLRLIGWTRKIKKYWWIVTVNLENFNFILKIYNIINKIIISIGFR